MPPKSSPQLADLTAMFSKFPTTSFPVQEIFATQQRNYEAFAKASQLAAESFGAVFRRQVEIANEFAAEGSTSVRNLFAPGAPAEKLAQNADLAKSAFERAMTNFRELSDLVTDANKEAAGVLTQRFSDSIVELKSAVKSAKAA